MRISDWSSDVCSSDLLKRETGAEVISAPVSLVRARPNLARCRMLRFRSGIAGLRLGKFQILAPPRHHCGGRLRVKSSQDLEKSSRSHSPAHAHRHYNVPNASPLSFQESMTDQAGTRHPIGMTHRYRATADIEPVVWNFQPIMARSEEHTSELQSLMRHSYAFFCLQKQ